MVLIEYVPYGDLRGFLKKSRGLNDSSYNIPDAVLQTTLTSQQLIKFAWEIADGMNFLSLNNVILLLLTTSLTNKYRTKLKLYLIGCSIRLFII